MKKYEKESFLKSFLLFFTTLLALNSIIFWLYFQEQKQILESEIFNKLKIYNYNFKEKDIKIDITPIKNVKNLYTLHVTKNEIFSYFNISNSKKNSLKIIYPYKKYLSDLNKIKKSSIIYFLISSSILFLLSIMYSIYSIKPLKNALTLLEEFLKDIIHDLNTPISSILLNLNILKRKKSEEAIKRIEYSTKNIGLLYKNLEISIKELKAEKREIDIKQLISEKTEYYKYLYPDILFETEIKIDKLKTSLEHFSRIIDNLISNACKYNKQNGSVKIYIDNKHLTIEDTGIGIKDTKKVFDRFYKESDRGIGLGLNIVKQLCLELGYKIEIKSKINIGTKIKVTFE